MENPLSVNMRTIYLRWILLLFLSFCSHSVRGSRVGFPGTSSINCEGGSSVELGSAEEGYSGDVEFLTGIPADMSVKLVGNLFPEHIKFLELVHNPGDSTAIIQTKMELDADVLTNTGGQLYYSIMCVNIGKLNNTRILTINDVNDNRPTFEKKLYMKTVSETFSVNTEVLKVKAVDADVTPANNRVSYSIVPPGSPNFDVRNDGAVMLVQRLNYNTAKNYNFTILARDNGNLNDSATVLIEVNDFDNLNPYFDYDLYKAFIPEEQTGAFSDILPEAIKAQDGDTGINMIVVYSISAVSPSKYLSNFEIGPSSGVISVVIGVDREEIGEVTINIKAAQEDDNMKFATTVMIVTIEDVNDNPPVFDKASYSATLLENSPTDTIVLRVKVTDLDEGGFNGTLRLLPETVPFSVSSDGTVTVKSSTELDRETVENFIFQIEARESDLPNRVVSADVNVTLQDDNDNSPLFGSAKYEGKVFRNQTEGMLVAKVEATDPDAGLNGLVKYSIHSGNQEGYFSINETTGEIRLVKIIPLEENKLLEFSYYVTARDGGVVFRSSSVLVEVMAPGDSKPQFLQSTYHGSIEEEKEPGVTILKVGFIAVTPVVSVTLQVLTDADKFAIDSNGVFTSTVKLDYETATNYSVRISISDGTSSDEAVVEVQVTDINDNSPVFASSPVTYTVPEDEDVGTNLTSVTATDLDDGFNGEIMYSLTGGEGKFSIDADSGLVTLTGALDRETQAEFSLKVVAQDQGRPMRSATASLLIVVSDINDNSPQFSKSEYQVEVLENAPVGQTLINVTAVDPDEDLNGRVFYSIVTQDPPSSPTVFELDSSTGVLRLAQGLDYGKAKGYILTVEAVDGGSPPLDGLSRVVVTVKDVNNNPPQFSKESYDVAVFENLAGGSVIITLEVTDEDEGGFSNGHFIFTSDVFDINKQGVVSLRTDATLDRETKANYLLQVTAEDQPVDGLNSTAQLNITVLDYNDNAPQFIDIPDQVSIPEGEYSASDPREVHRFQAEDADIGANAEVTISLASPSSLFRLREDGTLLVVGPLDRETRDLYDLVIVASDNGTPQKENFTTVRLSVTDMNDNTPAFSAPTYTKSILVKDAKVGDVVLTLSATDKDIGNNSLIMYSFTAGNSANLSLNGETGVITLASDLADVTEDTGLDLTAMAQDHGVPPLNSTARVLISLKTVSLSDGVAFESSTYNFSVAENEPKGATVGVVRASSGSSLYDITYVLTTHTDLFTVDPHGALSATETFDKETLDWYILEVEAVDTRIPPTSAVALVRVQVEDVDEVPEFIDVTYRAKIFSIVPYKYPVVQVKATDPDIGDSGRLQYSLSEPSPYFDVDPYSGQVFVVSATELGEKTTTVTVKATDPSDLQATAVVQVEVQGSDSSDVVVISLNRATNVVEQKLREMEEYLGGALGWAVRVISVSSSSGGADSSRALRNDVKTFVSLLSTDGNKVIPAKEIKMKLKQEEAVVKAELEKVFGSGVEFVVQEGPKDPVDDQVTVIVLGVLMGLSMLGLILMGTFTLIRSRRMKKYSEDSDQESFEIKNPADINSDRKTSGNSAQGLESKISERKFSQEVKPDFSGEKRDSNHEESLTSAL